MQEFKVEFADSWFKAAEAMFEDQDILTARDKYLRVMQLLPLEMIDKLKDFFHKNRNRIDRYSHMQQQKEHPNYTDYLYINLKFEVLKIAENERVKRLIEPLLLGEMRPSELLEKMTKLAGSYNVDDMEGYWLDRLPEEMKSVAKLDLSLQAKAKEADKIFDKNNESVPDEINEKGPDKADIQPISEVASTAECVSPIPSTNEVQEMREEIKLMRAELAELSQLQRQTCELLLLMRNQPVVPNSVGIGGYNYY